MDLANGLHGQDKRLVVAFTDEMKLSQSRRGEIVKKQQHDDNISLDDGSIFFSREILDFLQKLSKCDKKKTLEFTQ